jgi:hypothetical protein
LLASICDALSESRNLLLDMLLCYGVWSLTRTFVQCKQRYLFSSFASAISTVLCNSSPTSCCYYPEPTLPSQTRTHSTFLQYAATKRAQSGLGEGSRGRRRHRGGEREPRFSPRAKRASHHHIYVIGSGVCLCYSASRSSSEHQSISSSPHKTQRVSQKRLNREGMRYFQ